MTDITQLTNNGTVETQDLLVIYSQNNAATRSVSFDVIKGEVSPEVGALFTGTTDANGDLTITHTLGVVPSTVFLQPSGSILYNVMVQSVSSTNIVARVYDSTGTVLGPSVSVSTYWYAKP